MGKKSRKPSKAAAVGVTSDGREKKKQVKGRTGLVCFDPEKDPYDECKLCGKKLNCLSHWDLEDFNNIMPCCGLYLCRFCSIDHWFDFSM